MQLRAGMGQSFYRRGLQRICRKGGDRPRLPKRLIASGVSSGIATYCRRRASVSSSRSVRSPAAPQWPRNRRDSGRLGLALFGKQHHSHVAVLGQVALGDVDNILEGQSIQTVFKIENPGKALTPLQ